MGSRIIKQKKPPAGKTGPGAKAAPKGGGWLRRLVLGVFLALGVFVAYEYARLPSAQPLLKENPKTTALMDQRAEEAREAGQKQPPRRRQSWVSLTSISRPAVDSVILSEDSSFYQHEGVDTKELENALQEAARKGELGRGASTITQQLAKNLWLSTDRSLLRKIKELVLTRRLEEALPKNRILTLYLNVVEWGNGVYGIEAAAREHFGISASKLSAAQGAILASMLPAPRKRSVGSGSRALRRRSHWIIEQMEAVRRISASQAQSAHAEIDEILTGKKAEDDDDDGS